MPPTLAAPAVPTPATNPLVTAIFGSRPWLTPEQAQQAMHLWWKLWLERGPVTGVARERRLQGILGAVRSGSVGNTAWGRRGLAMQASYASQRARLRRRLEAQGWSPADAAAEAARLIKNQQIEKRARQKAAAKAARSARRCPTCGQRVDGV